MYRTHHHDLEGNPTSQMEPTKSVRCVVGSGKRVWISAPPTHLESTGNAPCAETCDPDSSELLRRFRNAVHHQKLHDKMDPTRGWHCHGMRHLVRPLRIGYSDHSQRSEALARGRFTWCRNQVLLVAIEAIKAVCSSAKAQESVLQRKAYFLREGASKFARSRCRTKRRHFLKGASGWKIAANVEGLRHYPQVLAESGKRSDVVLSSTKADTFVLAKLTVPWEDRIGQSNTLKEDRYMELTMDLQQNGYKVWFFAFEVGARGMVGQSTYTFLREIGFTSKVRSRALADMSRAAEAASQWIWSKRDCK